MVKKSILTVLFLLGSLSLYAQQEKIPWKQRITMLVVPREALAVQVAQDISRRYPVLLVCYQLTPADPVLHAWNGEDWVSVNTADYTNGTFFTHRPRHAVLIEEAGRPAPDLLIPDGTWCDKGNRLTSTDTRVMIHLLGRYFDFPYRYWRQFTKRYNYSMEEINPALINVPWIHYRGDEVIDAFKARDFDLDMDKWSDLYITQPEPIEPVILKAEPDALPPVEIPAEIPVEILTEEITDQPVNMPAEKPVETEDAVEVNTQPVEKASEKTVNEIMDEISETSPEVNPFSTNDIPAAELILSPAE